MEELTRFVSSTVESHEFRQALHVQFVNSNITDCFERRMVVSNQRQCMNVACQHHQPFADMVALSTVVTSYNLCNLTLIFVCKLF